MFTDPEAETTVLRDIAAHWDSVKSCCVRPGLARDLKKQGVAADQLASEPKWVALLSGVANLLSMSIVDVECKHALSRRWSDRTFPNIIAKHINRECQTSVQDARDRAKNATLQVSGASATSCVVCARKAGRECEGKADEIQGCIVFFSR